MPRHCCPYREAEFQRRLWTPRNDPSRIWAWWDFSDRGTITLGTGISQIKDKGPKGYHLSQATGSLQPTLSTCGGLPCASFASQWMDTGTTAIMTGTKLMVFLAGTMASTSDQYGRALALSINTSPDFDSYTRCAALITDNSTPRKFITYCGGAATPALSLSYDVPSIFSSLYTGTRFRVALNGTLGADVAKVTIWDVNRATVGKNWGEAWTWDGQYGEIIIVADYDERLRARIEGYLAWKWGLWGIRSRLVATHPFRNRPPMIGD